MVMSKADAFTQAGKTAVLQNIQGTLQFLQRFPPFNQMEHAHLAYLVEQCQLRFFAQGESIIKPADGPVEHFYIVKQGRVVGERQHITKPGTETTFEITTGECFPLAALLGERATRTEHLAGEDTFCLQLNKLAFIKLFALSSAFRDFALRGVSSLLDQVNQQVQQKAVETLGTQYSLNTRLGELAMRHPVTCSADTPLREAVKLMHEQQVGSIVAVDEHKAPLGIFTLRDLRHVVAEGVGDFSDAIEQHMTRSPFYLSPDHSAFDAAIAMTEPGAGSDLQGVKTTAVLDGDEYVINGSKTFITNGFLADLVIVVAKTDPKAGAKGTSLFLVEANTPGFEKGKRLEKVGMKAQDTSELFFQDVRVPKENLLGQAGAGFAYLMQELPQERLTVAIGGLPRLKRRCNGRWITPVIARRSASRLPISRTPASNWPKWLQRSRSAGFLSTAAWSCICKANSMCRRRRWPNIGAPTCNAKCSTNACNCMAATASCGNTRWPGRGRMRGCSGFMPAPMKS